MLSRRQRGSATADPGDKVAVATLAASTLAYAISQTLLIPAVPQIGIDLRVDEASAAWVLTAFFISSAVCTGVVGRLGDIFGKRRMLLVSIAIYASGAAISALAPSLLALVLGRVVMGAGAGMVPLAFAISRDVVHRSRLSGAMGTIATMIGLGAGVGMVLGGVLADEVSWRASFVAAGALSVAVFALTAAVLPASSTREPARVDVVGAMLLATGLGLVLLAIAGTAERGWADPRVASSAALGTAVLVVLVVVERRRTDPLLHVKTLQTRAVLFTNLASLTMGAGQIAVSILVVQVAQLPTASGGLGADASSSSLLIVPYSIAMILGSHLAGRFAGRHGGRVVLIIGSTIAAAGLVGLAVAPVTAPWLMLLAGLGGLGISMTLVTAPYLLADTVPQTRIGEATGTNTIARAVGQGLGTQVTAVTVASFGTGSSGVPSAEAYAGAFWISAGACGLAVVCGVAIGRRAQSVQVSPGVDTDGLARGAVASDESDHLLGDVVT